MTGSIVANYLLPLIIGYLFVKAETTQRLISTNEPSYKYVLRCVVWGFIITFIVSIFNNYLSFSLLKTLTEIISNQSGIKLYETNFLSLIFCFLFEKFNRFFETDSKKAEIIERVLSDKGLNKELMLFNNSVEDVENIKPIIINLKSRKVYIGYVIRFPFGGNNFPENFSVDIAPQYSGHRLEKDLTLLIDNNYNEYYDDVPIEEISPISVTINVDDIESVSPWNADLYNLTH